MSGVKADALTRGRHEGSGHSVRHAGVSHVVASALTDPSPEPVSAESGSRAVSGARLGEQLSELGVLQSYDSDSNTAMVQLLGAQSNVVGPLAVSKGLSSSVLVAGAQCLVVLMDADNISDGTLVSVW
jgi:hypothetical protein